MHTDPFTVCHCLCGVFSVASKGFCFNTLKNLQVLKASSASAGRFVFLGFTASVQPFRGNVSLLADLIHADHWGVMEGAMHESTTQIWRINPLERRDQRQK